MRNAYSLRLTAYGRKPCPALFLSPFWLLAFGLWLLTSSAFALPLFRDSLPNGLIILTYEDHRLPIADFALVCRSGAAFDPAGGEGTADLAADLLMRGTSTMPGDSVSGLIELLGAQMRSGADYDAANVTLRCLAKDADRILDLLSDAVLHPAFDQKEFNRARDRALIDARSSLDEPSEVVDYEYNRLLFGTHRYALPASGDTGSLRTLARDDVVRFHQTHFRPNNCFVVAVGDIDREKLVRAIEDRLGSWAPGPVPTPEPPSPAFTERIRVKLITRPDMNQSYVEFGHPGTSMLDEDMLATRIMAYVLGGGALSSRMGVAVREQAGLAYDVRCWFDRRTLAGAFRATVQTTDPKTAIRKMMDEVRLMRDSGATRAELLKAHNYYTGSFPLTYSSNRGKLRETWQLELYRFGLDWLETFPDKVRAVALADIEKAARDHLRPGHYLIVVLGNVTRDDLGLADVEWIE